MSPHNISADISHHTTEPLCPHILFQLTHPPILQNLYVPSFYFSWHFSQYNITSMFPNSISTRLSHHATEPLCPLILFQLGYPTILQNLYVPSFYFSYHIPPNYRTSMSPHSISALLSHYPTVPLCPFIQFKLVYPTILQNLYVP